MSSVANKVCLKKMVDMKHDFLQFQDTEFVAALIHKVCEEMTLEEATALDLLF